MSQLALIRGITRSLAIYYGIPFRARRMRRFYAAFVRAGDLCFDVGAHVGNRVRCWRSLGARVIAVEPELHLLQVLGWLYGQDDGVTIVPAALGHELGIARLLVDESNLTVTTLSFDWVRQVAADPAFRRVDWTSAGEVQVTTLDRLIQEFGEPAFVKIDVEGFEAEVLGGLSRPLRALSFEYLPATRELALRCVDRLEALGHYRYNWSFGECHRLASTRWIDAQGIRRFIRGLIPAQGCGDIYACMRVDPRS